MKSRLRMIWTLLAVSMLTASLAWAAGPVKVVMDTYHQDHRVTPKLQFEPQWSAPAGLRSSDVAPLFVEAMGDRYGLPAASEDLELVRVRESLLGFHHVYQQKIAGIPVDHAEFIVSVAKKDGRVYQVFNNIYPVKNAPAQTKASVGVDEAYGIAWDYLRAQSELSGAPMSRLVYTPEGEGFRLNYVIDLALSAPDGAWNVRVDAATGAVVAVEDTRLIRKITEETLTAEERLAAVSGPAWDRVAMFDRFAAQKSANDDIIAAGTLALGTGVVFDPDPRTTLNNNSLADNSAASAFTAAYFTRSLQDITLSGGLYRVTGPYVNIINFEAPTTAPSTTVDGNWTAVRGNNAFNDAMTYFHLDQNQRYMQSLGFTGPTGIQEGPIQTDTDGLSGADNSYFLPASNRLAFGHGCVDDNEDADVILHEYGHAIQHDITANWTGGDTGAMGEGFGDYWAASYSYVQPNGNTFFPDWIYTWDGHGASDACWPGRVLNATGAQYVQTTTYSAHASIPGGYQSDELWSTPLFQSLRTLMSQGYTRESVDQIILESHFGIGSGLKMRDMANLTIAAASALQPGGNHADVFIEKFLVHNIIQIPAASLSIASVAVSNAGANGVADPGELVHVTVELANLGTLGATALSASLGTSTALVQVPQGASAYPDLTLGATGTNLVDFEVAVGSDFVCGNPIALQLVVTYAGGISPSTTLNFSVGTGVPNGAAVSVAPALAIPDNTPAGVTSTLNIVGSGGTVTSNFNVDLNITHTWRGDLRVTLRSPAGTSVILHNLTGSSADNIVGNYPLTLTPAQSLATLIGQPLDGIWSLIISDNAGDDTGILNSWGINDVTGYECDTFVSAVDDGALPSRFAVSQNRPNPFNPSTTISFAVPENAGQVTLAIFDVSGRLVRTLESGSLGAGTYTREWNGRDDMGRAVGSGTYFYRLAGNEFSESRKMILIQ
jgi:subtilisin-like proprotein convertase family protein